MLRLGPYPLDLAGAALGEARTFGPYRLDEPFRVVQQQLGYAADLLGDEILSVLLGLARKACVALLAQGLEPRRAALLGVLGGRLASRWF